MANEEHVAKLKEGAEAWNQWRREHSDVVPDLREAQIGGADLSGADLRGAHLGEADLRRTDLHGADLRGADLGEAHLSGANLRRADLGGAYLRRAYFIRADLGGADLRGANLAGANLMGADFSGADLRRVDLMRTDLVGANFSGADLGEAHLSGTNLGGANFRGADFHQTVLTETMFADTDLREVRGLETCNHRRPSTIDHRTLAKSGPLPLAFLRGCGLPDVLIDYLPSLLKQPLQLYSCFISYSTEDQEFAERLHADLQNKGVRCWFAPKDLKIGESFRHRIDKEIRLHEKLLVILSEHSVHSAWVREEVESALERERREKRVVLFPLCLDNAAEDADAAWAASIRRQRQIGDFSKWKDHDLYRKAFDRLLRDLKATEPRTNDIAAPH
jgi:uncharacterized protein YjbI with pentapeptide repeats